MVRDALATSFVGRVSEIEHVGQLLERTRLLTIMGTAGSGKTRLAYEVARQLKTRYSGGVFFCELALLAEGDRLPAAVADCFGHSQDPGDHLTRILSQQLGDRPALLVLDNCEHLRSGVTTLTVPLLAGLPTLSILATSRERLRVSGETAWTIPPLSLPDESDGLESSDAATLLIERVRMIDPGYSPSADARVALAQICRRLEGLPLAIELAASRLAVLPAAHLLDMLDDALSALGADEGLARQRSLRAALDWSFDLLSEQDRAAFCRLSLFAGPFSLAAASALLERTDAAAVDRLAALRDRSLLNADTSGPRASFRMLEPVRQYAGERLQTHSDHSVAGRLHAKWVVATTEEIRASAFGRDQSAAARTFKELLPDFRRAFGWSLTHEPSWAARMAAASDFLWDMTGQLTEGDLILQAALEAGPTERELARIYIGLSNLADRRGDLKLRTYAELAVAAARSAAAEKELGYALFMLGFALREQSPDRSNAAFDEASEMADRVGDTLLRAWVAAIRTLGLVASGRVIEARRAHEAQIPVVLEIGDVHSATIASANLARICMIQGDNAAARRALRAHWRLLVQHQNWAVSAPVLITASTLAARAGLMRESAELAGAYWRLCELFDRKPFPNEPELDLVRGHLSRTDYEAAIAKGAALQIGEMFDLAMRVAEGSDSTDYGRLTNREMEVAKLVARGLSNKEVAARLRRSERTIESHVGHALGKLNMSSRTELGAWAQQHGLLD
jgi:predicted ATPase/DNA-binding CsgD family transcriptional regulator